MKCLYCQKKMAKIHATIACDDLHISFIHLRCFSCAWQVLRCNVCEKPITYYGKRNNEITKRHIRYLTTREKTKKDQRNNYAEACAFLASHC